MGRRLALGEITVDVVQKDIKNIHLSVYPPNGGVVAPVARKQGGFQVCVVRNNGEWKALPAKGGSVLAPGFDRTRPAVAKWSW